MLCALTLAGPAAAREATAPASGTSTDAGESTGAHRSRPTGASGPVSTGASGSPPATSGSAPAAEPTAASIPTTPRAQHPVYAAQDNFTTPRPGPQTSNAGQPVRRWHIRQAPLAGAEASWGAPGNQMPEYAELGEPPLEQSGPPPRGMGRIVTGAILGPAGLALTIACIVGATTTVLGDHKRLSVPMIGGGLVTSALGWALFADGILRRKNFQRWQAGAKKVVVAPALAPGRFAGVMVIGRF